MLNAFSSAHRGTSEDRSKYKSAILDKRNPDAGVVTSDQPMLWPDERLAGWLAGWLAGSALPCGAERVHSWGRRPPRDVALSYRTLQSGGLLLFSIPSAIHPVDIQPSFHSLTVVVATRQAERPLDTVL
ncbi:hypothetical protein NHX12_002726 [Muraenolepis orangiensis]|uniref:Uncharacterized protein n=1 Tax=Muraenolepis orangiensis TaxID=630683 RepID=A0A9Q0DX77_9TELE|nr:hypothetical protein NHX12_002726 [Muraenolepis orangiensis]